MADNNWILLAPLSERAGITEPVTGNNEPDGSDVRERPEEN